MSEPTTAAEVAAAIAADYGVYVAAQNIDIDGVRAFNKGDAVPVSHVERGVVSKDQVERSTAKAGRPSGSDSESKG